MTTSAVLKPLPVPVNIKSYFADESARRYDMYKNEIDAEGWDMLWKSLKSINAPTPVLYGYKDRFFDASCIEVFNREMKIVETVIIKKPVI